MKTDNHVPELLNAIRLSLGDIAAAVGVGRNAADLWRSGLYRPGPATRKRLVRYVRKHATTLLALADAIEAEGKQRDGARARQRRRAVLKS